MSSVFCVSLRLYRGGEPQSERHWREEGHQSGSGSGEEVLPLSSVLQTLGGQHGNPTPAESPQSGTPAVSHSALSCDTRLHTLLVAVVSFPKRTFVFHSNWPITSGTLCLPSAVNSSRSCWRWTERRRSTVTTGPTTRRERPKPCCSECFSLTLPADHSWRRTLSELQLTFWLGSYSNINRTLYLYNYTIWANT